MIYNSALKSSIFPVKTKTPVTFTIDLPREKQLANFNEIVASDGSIAEGTEEVAKAFTQF